MQEKRDRNGIQAAQDKQFEENPNFIAYLNRKKAAEEDRDGDPHGTAFVLTELELDSELQTEMQKLNIILDEVRPGIGHQLSTRIDSASQRFADMQMLDPDRVCGLSDTFEEYGDFPSTESEPKYIDAGELFTILDNDGIILELQHAQATEEDQASDIAMIKVGVLDKDGNMKTYYCLIDSCASKNCISQTLADKAKHSKSFVSFQEFTRPVHMVAANKQSMRAIGILKLRVYLKTKVYNDTNFIVIPDLSQDMILGKPTLRRMGAVIDLEANNVTLRKCFGVTIPLANRPE